VHKVHIHIQRKWLWDNSTSLEQTNLLQSVPHRTIWCAMDSVWCPSWSTLRTDRSRESRSLSTKNHRTVRCATGLSVSPRSNDRLRDCVRSLKRQKTVCDDRSHRTVRCVKRTEVFNGQQLQTPTVGWRDTHRIVNSVVSGAPPDCPVCPSTKKSAND
jgi:hypothetical protein